MSETPRRANVLLPVGASYAMLFATGLYIVTAAVGYGIYGEYIGAGGSMLDALGYGVPSIIAWVFIVLVSLSLSLASLSCRAHLSNLLPSCPTPKTA